jgi:hypothetical protein
VFAVTDGSRCSRMPQEALPCRPGTASCSRPWPPLPSSPSTSPPSGASPGWRSPAAPSASAPSGRITPWWRSVLTAVTTGPVLKYHLLFYQNCRFVIDSKGAATREAYDQFLLIGSGGGGKTACVRRRRRAFLTVICPALRSCP